MLFNNADGNYEVRYKSNVLIYPNGEVLWVPPAIYQSSCTIDVTYFPFDQQTCIMKFGSWTFNGDQVSLALYNNKNFVDLSDYWKSGTWWVQIRFKPWLTFFIHRTCSLGILLRCRLTWTSMRARRRKPTSLSISSSAERLFSILSI